MDLADKNNKKGFCRKKISVIIPVYNAEKYIRETLDSIIKQSYENWEIILVENGSEDKSPDIIREYEEKYTEIHMIKSPGKGPGPARNVGLEAAQGEYIVFVDSDDYIPDEDVFYQYISITESINADIVVSNYARLWDGKLLPAQGTQTFALSSPLSEAFRFQGFFSVGTLSYVWGKLYKREFLKKNQIVFTDSAYAEDKLFNIQCYMSGAVYAYIEDRGYIYRKNDNSISYRYKPESMKCWLTIAGTLQKDMTQAVQKREVYEGFIRYLIFFAAFFDAEMDYTAYHRSKKAVRRCLKAYSTHPLAAKCIK